MGLLGLMELRKGYTIGQAARFGERTALSIPRKPKPLRVKGRASHDAGAHYQKIRRGNSTSIRGERLRGPAGRVGNIHSGTEEDSRLRPVGGDESYLQQHAPTNQKS